MNYQSHKDLPIRSKVEMVHDIVSMIQSLHSGKKEAILPLVEDLKSRSLFLNEEVQQDVLMFVEQVQFQYDYDPWHRVTKGVQQAADQLIEDLGFHIDPPAWPPTT